MLWDVWWNLTKGKNRLLDYIAKMISWHLKNTVCLHALHKGFKVDFPACGHNNKLYKNEANSLKAPVEFVSCQIIFHSIWHISRVLIVN